MQIWHNWSFEEIDLRFNLFKKKNDTVNYVKGIEFLSNIPICDSYDVVSIKPDQIKLTYNGITMENDNLKLWLYGINQSCKIYMLLKLGMKNYHISREISFQRKKIQFDVPKTKNKRYIKFDGRF